MQIRRRTLLMAVGMLAATSLSAEPPKPVDVYLIAGQSNATGQGYVRNLPAGFVVDAHVLLFHSGKPHLDSGAPALTWMPLRPASESPDRFGPEIGFGNRMAALNPARTIALIKHAHTGTDLYRDWYPGTNAADETHWGPQFKTFVETVDAGLQGLRDQGFAPTIRGMVWQQGEGDARLPEAKAYGANLAHFIARVRDQFAAPDMVFVYGYVLPPPNVGAERDAVRAGQQQVDQDSGKLLAVPGAFVVETDDLSQRARDRGTPYPNDHVHFGTAGTIELGIRLADTMNAHLPPK